MFVPKCLASLMHCNCKRYINYLAGGYQWPWMEANLFVFHPCHWGMLKFKLFFYPLSQIYCAKWTKIIELTLKRQSQHCITRWEQWMFTNVGPLSNVFWSSSSVWHKGIFCQLSSSSYTLLESCVVYFTMKLTECTWLAWDEGTSKWPICHNCAPVCGGVCVTREWCSPWIERRTHMCKNSTTHQFIALILERIWWYSTLSLVFNLYTAIARISNLPSMLLWYLFCWQCSQALVYTLS